jgi:eukaryotic-like serine/threonine-protein kinase
MTTTTRKRINGRYRLVERIAVGATAEVWRARDEELDRPVAVKLLHPHLLPDETSRRRLEGEARTAASLSHAGIVEVYDVSADDPAPALVMELVEGESLDARLAREGPLPAAEAAHIARAVAEALYHAHRRGVVHRDVKPSNILLDGDGRARLGDFGIARSLEASAERLTLTGTVVGTPRYMAPEQLTDGDVGPRADLYGLGAVLHEMLTGRPPYPETSPVALAQAQAAGPPELPNVDPTLAAVVRACLAASPEERPRHAGAVAEALRAWLDGDSAAALAIAAAPASAVETPVDPAAETQTAPALIPAPAGAAPTLSASSAAESQERAAAPGSSRRRILVIGGGLVAVLLLGTLSLAGLGAWLGGPSATATPTLRPTPTPRPAWIGQLRAEYLEACGSPLDLDSILGLSREAATDRVEEQIDACHDAAGSPGPGKGKGHGKGGEDGRGGDGGHGKD